MEKYLPRSGIAIIAFGILFAELICSQIAIDKFKFFFSLLCFLVITEIINRIRYSRIDNLRYFSIYGDRKYFQKLILGIAIGLAILQYRNFQTNKNQESLNQFLTLLKNKNLEWTISPRRMIRKGIYMAEWMNGFVKFTFPLQIYKPDSIYVMRCFARDINPKDFKESHFLYQSLSPYGNKYFQLRMKNCTQLDEIIYPNIVIKNNLKTKLINYGLEDDELAIAMGLVFGDSSYLDQDFYQAALESGTLHLFAASGLHIGILIGFLYFLGKYLFRFNYYLSYSFPLIFAALYLYLLAFPVSLTRAYYFAFVLVISKIIFRTIRPIDLLFTSALVVFLFRAEMYRSIGFYLSFSAVAGIFFLKPACDSLLFFGKKTLFSENLTLTLSASFATFLPAFVYFNGYSWGAVLSNYVLVPLTSLILPFLYLNIFLGWLLPNHWIGYLWYSLKFALQFLSFSMKFISYKVGFYREWGNDSLFLIFYIIVLILFFLMSFEYVTILGRVFSQNKEAKDIEKPNFFIWFHRITSLIGFCLIIIFFFYGFSVGQDIHTPKKDGIYHLSNDSYFLIQGKNGSLGGYCGNDQEALRRKIHFYTCKNLDYLYIDHFSCLTYVSFCFKNNKNMKFLIGSKKIKLDNIDIPIEQFSKIKKNSFYTIAGESFLFFKSGLDPYWLPKYIAKKNPKGTIILQNPTVKKKNYKQKKIPFIDSFSEKSLGLSKQWKILNLNDVSRFSLFQTDGDPKSPGINGSESTEIVGSELFD